jgi:hypothetical protein
MMLFVIELFQWHVLAISKQLDSYDKLVPE